MKALHVTQARAGIDLFRATVGLSAASYTHMTIASNDAIRAVDWMEMRTRLDEARALVMNLTAVPAYSDSAIAAGLAVKSAHLNDFWARMK